MTDKELEKDYYADRPTEPYSDDDNPNDWANIAHYAEENLEKAFNRIAELEAENERIKTKYYELQDTLKNVRLALIKERTANIMNYGKGGVEMFDSIFETLKGVSN